MEERKLSGKIHKLVMCGIVEITTKKLHLDNRGDVCVWDINTSTDK